MIRFFIPELFLSLFLRQLDFILQSYNQLSRECVTQHIFVQLNWIERDQTWCLESGEGRAHDVSRLIILLVGEDKVKVAGWTKKYE